MKYDIRNYNFREKRHFRSKLTLARELELLKSYTHTSKDMRQLAEEFGVSLGTVAGIVDLWTDLLLSKKYGGPGKPPLPEGLGPLPPFRYVD